MYAYELHISYKTLKRLQYIDNMMVHLALHHTSNNYLDISLERLDNLNLDLPLSYAESYYDMDDFSSAADLSK